MAKYTRIQVALKMMETGLVPVFYHSNIEVCKSIAKACFEGGARILEFTNRGDFAHEVFKELNKFSIKELPGMLLGAGSIVDAATTSIYIQLGANFIVSPVLKDDMAIVCNRRKILWIPGCGSLNEISRAEELGAEIVKIFPAIQVGGPEFIKSIKGPSPWTSIMPTGGVEPEEDNLRKWFDAGATCVGMGSNLISADIMKENKLDELKNKVNEVLGIIQKVRA